MKGMIVMEGIVSKERVKEFGGSIHARYYSDGHDKYCRPGNWKYRSRRIYI